MCFNIGIVTCGPNEAMVISGICYGSTPGVIAGGRAIVCPCMQTIQRIPLTVITILVESQNVYTRQGVALSITGVAQVRVNGANDDMIRKAAEIFGNKNQTEMEHISRETLEGHQRAVMGMSTVEQIYKERNKFSSAVHKVASEDFIGMGMVIISYTIKDIKDSEGYLLAVGVQRTEEVKRDALIGEAEAKKESSIAKSNAKMDTRAAELINLTMVAKAERNYDISKAAFDVEVNTAKADAELAYQLRVATLKQLIQEEISQVQVVERLQEIEIQEQEVLRKEKELQASIIKPAEAEKYRLRTIAKAKAARVIIEADGEAKAIEYKSDAEAFAIYETGKADAIQMEKKAEAWEEYQKAAVVDMVLKTIPKIAAEVSTPLSKVEKITMVDDGSGNIGASMVAQEVIDIMKKAPEVVKEMTGVDLEQLLQRANQKQGPKKQ